MKNTLSTVAILMPAKTAVPRDQRDAAPAPEATTRGIIPATKEMVVIKMARKRSRAPSMAASKAL
jgi:hypothetical protein